MKLAISAALTAWELVSYAQMHIARELLDHWDGTR